MDIGLVMYVIASTLVAVLGIPLMRRRIKPNGLYGLRIRETLKDERVWYEANAKSGRGMVVVGVIGVALSIGLHRAPNVSEETYHSVMIGYLLGAVILTFAWDVRMAKRLAAELESNPE